MATSALSMCPQMHLSLHAHMQQAGLIPQPGLHMQAQYFPAEGILTAMTKILLQSVLLSELYPDISLYVINFLSYSVSQLQDFYPMTHLPPCQKGFVFFLLCFASLCFVLFLCNKDIQTR